MDEMRNQIQSNAYKIPFAITVSGNLGTSAASGKLSRSELKRQREKTDPAYRERSIAARKALAEEFSTVQPTSLAMLRLQRGMSQHDLATAIGTSQPHIAKIEGGQVKLYLETASRLADCLGVSIDRLNELIDFHHSNLTKTAVQVES